jgi:glutamate synthase (NADPH/NADH) small chain
MTQDNKAGDIVELRDLVRQAQKLVAFPDVSRENPLTISATEARQSFVPVDTLYDTQIAMKQAGRCGQCATPFCSIGTPVKLSGCPLNNNIPDWLQKLAQGQIELAIDQVYRTNPMPDATGFVCPKAALCEGACVLYQSDWGAVSIGNIERFLSDTAWKYGLVPPINPRGLNNEFKVAVIGSGPAGFAASAALADVGYHVEIFERSEQPGGLLRYGIPAFKMPKEVVDRNFQRLDAAPNVVIHTRMSIGQCGEGDAHDGHKHIPFADLVREFDAIVIATGTYRSKSARMEGDAASEVLPAIDYLSTQDRVSEGTKVPGYSDDEGNPGWLNGQGKRVVVVGGGDTWIDCMRTAKRQGAAEVIGLYYKGPDDVKANDKDLGYALREFQDDDRIRYYSKAKAMERVSDKSYKVTVAKTQMVDGKLVEVPGGDEVIEADLVISAVGFEPEDLPSLFNIPEMPLKPDGTLAVNPVHHPDPYPPGTGTVGRVHYGDDSAIVVAAGDIVRGPSLVVQGLRDGKDAAKFLHDALRYPERIKLKYKQDHIELETYDP